MEKTIDILNSEGTILGLYKDKNSDFILGAFLSNGKGTVFFNTSKNDLLSYLNSRITLTELYDNSPDVMVRLKSRDGHKTYLKMEFSDLLQNGQDYYTDLPESMKSDDISKIYGS